MENHFAHLRDIDLMTGTEKNSAFPMYFWIGEHEITKLKKDIFASNPEKRTQKQAQKDMNQME